jgi:hypothetical protein
MDNAVSSQQVNWLTVHRFVGAVLNQVNDWPMAGTPAWCSLAHDDPRKWAALLDGAQHWALRIDSSQEAKCEASQAISAAPLFTNSGDPIDWPAIGRERLVLSAFFAARPWLRRVVA